MTIIPLRNFTYFTYFTYFRFTYIIAEFAEKTEVFQKVFLRIQKPIPYFQDFGFYFFPYIQSLSETSAFSAFSAITLINQEYL